MRSALIGYTGFVGGNLQKQFTFDDVYNSQSIGDIEGKTYDIVYSAANRAEMWRINQDPETDLAQITDYIGRISKARIGKLVLISTVGVYKSPNGADEDTIIDTDGLSPYGSNRYFLEQYCNDNFDTTIIRLPGLYGNGLKKNVIYDLLHNNNVEKIHKDGTYQYYDLKDIYKDIQIVLDNNLSLVNFATPPIKTKDIAHSAFAMDFTNEPDGVVPAVWDMRTKHAGVFGGKDGYMISKEDELGKITSFVSQQRSHL